MRRRHLMPFGAEVLGDGRTRFTLWAPAVGEVDLILEDRGALPMHRGEDGAFALTTEAGPGARYRYRIDGGQEVPDPASRYQPEDVHGPSRVVDPGAFVWRDGSWKGRQWEEVVLYELHVGSFTSSGTFAGVGERLDYLLDLGVTAIELMPLSEFPGRRNWGYDGVLHFAPESAYGTPEDLKGLVQAAHAKGLMVFLDVVYNHFGPEGNYLPLYVPQFFTERYHTPWGAAIDFEGERVREFFVHNALYWLEEYNIDGLRLDAVHAIRDESEKHFLVELAERVRSGPGRERHVHLVLENEAKEVSYLRGPYNAQWNDDIHHALHVTLTGESAGYYADYADSPVQLLGRCLAEGFAYPAEPDANLSPSAFVSFVQNHDQIGNRAFGERIVQLARPEALRAAAEIYLLAPQIPMLFMGEERGASTPFPFFCDFEPELAQLVARGRREEFAAFPEFSDPASRERIPDPGAEETFRAAVLDWGCLRDPECGAWLNLYGELLSLRHEKVVPRLGGISGGRAAYRLVGDRGLSVRWTLQDGALLTLLANLGPEPLGGFETPPGELLYTSDGVVEPGRVLPGWSVSWHYAGAG